MINGTFKLAGDLVSVKIEGNSLAFFDISTGQMTTLEGLRMSKAGVLKEFPDLKHEIDWRKIAIERLKTHMKTIETEMKKMNYIKGELIKFGYEPLHYQKSGFRTRKFGE